MKCGLVQSKLDGTEKKVNITKGNMPLSYSLKKLMPEVLDQGDTSKCVAYSTANALNYYSNIKEITKRNYEDMIDAIYNARSDKSKDEGMSIKDALHYIRGIVKKDYAIIGSEEQLKRSLIAYGPCLAALPCYNSHGNFWKPSGKLLGGHCVLIIGYDATGFIIMNSWGKSWNIGGFTTLPYSDFKSFKELWTLI